MREKELLISLYSKIWINNPGQPLPEGTYDRCNVKIDLKSHRIIGLCFRKLNLEYDEFDPDSLVFREHHPKILPSDMVIREDCSNWDVLKIAKRPNPDRIYKELYRLTPNPTTVGRCRVNGFQLDIGGVEGFTIETNNGVFNFQTEEVTSVTRDNNNNKFVITTIDKKNRPKQVSFNLDEIRRVTFVS